MPAPIAYGLSRSSVYLVLALLALAYPVRAQGVNFTLLDINDRSIQLADFRGQWVIVNFWASWCTPCLLELPELQAFYEVNSTSTAVISVNLDDITASEIRPFVTQLGVTFPIALSGGQSVPDFEVKGLPTTFFISPTGQLVDAHLGAVNAALLTKRLITLKRTSESAR